MSDTVPEAENRRPTRTEFTTGPARLMFLVGSLAILAAMATDFAAVISRHLRIPLIGAIEVIQGCILVAISASIICTTVARGHATVHLVVDRLPPAWRDRFHRVGHLLCFVTFALIAVGNFWLFADTWGWDERSDLLGLPIWPFRLIWAVSLAVVAGQLLAFALRRSSQPQ